MSLYVSKVEILNVASHKFEPQGFTLVALLSESHFSFHTFPEKLGGWEERDASIGATIGGTIRSILSGTTNLGQRWVVYGTNTHVYLENGQALYDVTPYRTAATSLTNPFSLLNESIA